MDEFLLKQISSMKYETKVRIADIGLLALGVTFELLSGKCAELDRELEGWRENFTFSMAVLQDGPSVTIGKQGDRIRYLGRGVKDPDLSIYFKNIDSGLLVFLGVMGAHTAAIQRRTIIHGNIVEAVKTVRAMGIVQKYLFPGFIVNKTFKRPPAMNFSENVLKAQVYTLLVPSLLLMSGR